MLIDVHEGQAERCRLRRGKKSGQEQREELQVGMQRAAQLQSASPSQTPAGSSAARNASARPCTAPARCWGQKHCETPVSTAPGWVIPESTTPAPSPSTDSLFLAAGEIQETQGKQVILALTPAPLPLKLSLERPVGTGYSPRGSPSPAEQEQRVVAAPSLHPGPLRVMHRAPATTTTRPHLPVARVWELAGCGGNWPKSSLKPP